VIWHPVADEAEETYMRVLHFENIKENTELVNIMSSTFLYKGQNRPIYHWIIEEPGCMDDRSNRATIIDVKKCKIGIDSQYASYDENELVCDRCKAGGCGYDKCSEIASSGPYDDEVEIMEEVCDECNLGPVTCSECKDDPSCIYYSCAKNKACSGNTDCCGYTDCMEATWEIYARCEGQYISPCEPAEQFFAKAYDLEETGVVIRCLDEECLEISIGAPSRRQTDSFIFYSKSLNGEVKVSVYK